MLKLYLQSVSNPELQYEVVQYDELNKVALLAGGSTGTQLEVQNFTKDYITKKGYKLVKKEVHDG